MTTQLAVTPPNFDMRNALHADDIIWPIGSAFGSGADTWGRMIVMDREAGLSIARYGMELSHKYEGLVWHNRARIKATIDWGKDQDIYAVY